MSAIVINIDTSLTNVPTIEIGKQGENGATQVVFDVSEMIETYGSGTAYVVVQRRGDAEPYLLDNTSQSGDTVTWTVSNVDTDVYGTGRVQLFWMIDEQVSKTVIYQFYVEEALHDPHDAPVVPGGWISDEIGNLDNLTTTAKANLVAAINEVNSKATTNTTAIGTLANLTTTEKNNLVGALNEVNEDVSDVKEDLDSAILFPNSIINVENSTVGYQLSNYATESANQSFSISEYIPIAEGQEYTFGLGTGDLGRVSFYQTADTSQPICLSSSDWYSGKVPSSIESLVNWFTVNDNNTMSFTVPSGYTDRQGRHIKYMRFTYYTAQADKAFCIKGTTLIDDVSFLGKVPYLDEEINDIYEQIPRQDAVIDCLGDSHTSGVSTYMPYPSILETLIDDYTVQNFGGGGDGASDITAKQGALYAVCDPCTIEDSSSYTNHVPLKMYSGDGLRQFGMKWVGINKNSMTGDLNCLLGDKPVYVSYDSTNGFRIRPTSTGGGDIIISRPTKITTTYMQTSYRNHILILCMGSNGVNNITVQKLADWNRLIAKQYERYIIVGEPTVISASNRANYNDLMYSYFGVHYLDIHDYMVNYGLQDAGITPTSADEAAIAQGNTPPSLLYDSVHYNQDGIDIMANQIYLKGKELGYWS